MKRPVFHRPRPMQGHHVRGDNSRGYDGRRNYGHRNGERGVTMVLVALCMVALIAMAALSIDVVTLYLDREEAQRAADAAALAAARIISISGITGTADPGGAGDPGKDTPSWQAVCGTSGTATLVAKQVGAINPVAGSAPTVTVNYSAQGATGGAPDCSGLTQAFAINPTVIVQVKRTGLPTLFSRIWSRSSNTVSATAAAEVFNPSDSGTIAGGQEIPVVPSCVKPWILPDEDPEPSHAGKHFVGRFSGKISSPGIFQIDGGVIGEGFTMKNNCSGPNCSSMTNNPPLAGFYIPALISTATPAVAVPPGCASNDFQKAIAGCDVSTVYACGTPTPNGAQADLTTNRGADTFAAVQCLIRPTGNDTLDTSTNPYPFQIIAGSSNPIIATANQVITSSNSIMTIPIYDDMFGGGAPVSLTFPQPKVTIVGFLQVFVNGVDPSGNGNLNVRVLNVAGCGNDASPTPAPGTSPVPIRLITPQ
jgi:Flp pilus assembly protein TadG